MSRDQERDEEERFAWTGVVDGVYDRSRGGSGDSGSSPLPGYTATHRSYRSRRPIAGSRGQTK